MSGQRIVMKSKRVMELDAKHHMNVYGPRFYGDVVPIFGEGVKLYDSKGRDYIDCVAGIACNILGYGDKKFNKALLKVLDDGILHTSNLFYNEPQARYVKSLCGLLFMKNPKVFPCGSGADAVNGAIKCAAKNKGNRSSKNYQRNRNIVSYFGAFHGRIGPALAVTDPKYHKGKDFDITLPKGVKFINLNDEKGLEKITEKTYAVIIEPIQGEGGIIEVEKRYMKKLRTACNKAGALLIADEVQTGFGRTGKLFAMEHYGVKPDITCMAKGIANGLPFGAFAVNKKADLLVPGEHATTFGGNYLACTAANVVLTEINQKGLMENAINMESIFFDWYNSGVESNPHVVDARGKGLMLGLEMETADQRKEVISGCLEDGLIVAPSGTKTIRLVPPLVISKTNFKKALATVKRNIKKL